MNKEELLRRARMFDEDTKKQLDVRQEKLKSEEEKKDKNLLQVAQGVPVNVKGVNTDYSEEDFELVEAWLRGLVSPIQIVTAKKFKHRSTTKVPNYMLKVLRHFYRQGRVKIIK